MSGCLPHWKEWAGGNLGRGRQPCHAELRYLNMKNGLELGSWRPCGHLVRHHFWFFPLQLSLGLLLVLALVLGWIVDWFASWRCSGFKSEVIFGSCLDSSLKENLIWSSSMFGSCFCPTARDFRAEERLIGAVEAWSCKPYPWGAIHVIAAD